MLNSAPIRVRGCSEHPAPILIGADGNGKPGAVSERHTLSVRSLTQSHWLGTTDFYISSIFHLSKKVSP